MPYQQPNANPITHYFCQCQFYNFLNINSSFRKITLYTMPYQVAFNFTSLIFDKIETVYRNKMDSVSLK